MPSRLETLRSIPAWAWAILVLTFGAAGAVLVLVVPPVLARILFLVRGSPVGPL